MDKSTGKPETGSLMGTKVQKPSGRDDPRFIKLAARIRAEPEAFEPAIVAFPTVAEWLAMSKVKLGKRSSSRLIPFIDAKVQEFHANAGDDWAQLWTLIDVYFGTNAWLKQDHGYVGRGRTKGVKKLFELTVAELCNRLQVSVNVLPREFERLMGRELTAHGFKLDRERDLANYLSRSALRDCRIEFQGGRLMKKRRTIGVFRDGHALLPLDSHIDAPRPRGEKIAGHPLYKENPRPLLGYKQHAGFAMNMARELFVSQHSAGGFLVGGFDFYMEVQGQVVKVWGEGKYMRNEKNFYHSSYLAGQPVMCSGTMLVENGFIKELSNSSGHYRPTPFHLYLCVQGLRMHGVNMERVEKIILTLADGTEKVIVKDNGKTPVQQLEESFRTMSAQKRVELARQAFTQHQDDFADKRAGQPANAPGGNGNAPQAPAAKKSFLGRLGLSAPRKRV